MEELQIGEYIRTPYHKIEKIEKITKENGWTCITTNKDAYELQWLKDNKVKHSKNIIDLIEKDDYVNGCRVYEVEEKGITVYQKVEDSSTDYNYIPKDEIKIIWTKEQLKTIEYNV